MTHFHTDALEAAHTQREMDEIPQRVREQHEAEFGPVETIWLDAFPPGQNERGIWSRAHVRPTATAVEMTMTQARELQSKLSGDPRHATLRLLRAELAAEKRKEAKARHEAQLLTQAIYRVRKELGV